MADAPVGGDPVAEGWSALARGAWAEARLCFEQGLEASESAVALEGLSWAAWWLEDVEACLDARQRAYWGYQQTDEPRGAARMALWLGDDHLEFHGARAVAEGWFRRAARILVEVDPCPEHGWLAIFEAHAALGRHEWTEARRLAVEAREVGRRHGAWDLETFALASEGVARVEQGDVVEGLRCLDEAGAATLGGEHGNLAPAAWSCCLVISTYEQLRRFDRASQWCEQIAAFSERMNARFLRGVCRAHYGVVLAWRGRWVDADDELTAALEELTVNRPSWRAEALVRLGELRRRQGRHGDAEALLAQVPEHPLAQQGMAALCLDRGDPVAAVDLAERMVRRIGDHGASRFEAAVRRAEALGLLVRAQAALGEHVSASTRLEELRGVAETVATDALWAMVRRCEAAVGLVGDPGEQACDRLEDAADLYARAGAPVEAAAVRVDLAETLAALGREDAAERVARSAVGVLEAAGASVEAAKARALLDRRSGPPHRAQSGGDQAEVLTSRQLEVLRLVAEGCVDQDIADRLVLSTHTVHRHVANIYSRLGCSTRAAAVAEASRRGLL